ARALWIIPVALGATAIFWPRKPGGKTEARNQPKVQAPWFIGFFVLASAARAVGWRPFLQGVLLWLFISVVSLAAIVRFV
ncbi:MAG TPA: hypothetical protein VNY04_11205, partial [Chthoniobacterales bacterium]|nr:hypothetical protein [Chthoniobacterales bacterium]